MMPGDIGSPSFAAVDGSGSSSTARGASSEGQRLTSATVRRLRRFAALEIAHVGKVETTSLFTPMSRGPEGGDTAELKVCSIICTLSHTMRKGSARPPETESAIWAANNG